MAIISQECTDAQCRSKTILRFSREFELAQVLRQANVRRTGSTANNIR